MIISHAGIEYNVDVELSLRDFTGHDMSTIDLFGKVIYGSTFSREVPDSAVFPKNMSGAKFIKCNLDNVLMPGGNELIDCSTRRFKFQNDLEDWLINESGDPVEPVNKKTYLSLGLSTDPKDLPSEPLKQSILSVI